MFHYHTNLLKKIKLLREQHQHVWEEPHVKRFLEEIVKEEEKPRCECHDRDMSQMCDYCYDEYYNPEEPL